jgi:hypothetical protein
MKRDDAGELADRWHEVAGSNLNSGPAYTALQRAARQLLPTEVTAGGAAVVDGVPTMLAFAGDGLFLVHATPSDDGRGVTTTVKRLPVVSDGMTVELTDGLAGKREGRDVLMRRWRFGWPDGTTVEFEACAYVFGWNEGPDSAELVARALAAAIGWSIPAGEG